MAGCGHVAGYDVGSQKSSVDALFALLRLNDGSFKFNTGTPPLNTVEPEEVAPLLEQAEAASTSGLKSLPLCRRCLPGCDCRSQSRARLPDPRPVASHRINWRRSLRRGRSTATDLAEFDGTKAMKELVDLHLVWSSPWS